jgi:hypothetical protein
METTRVNEDTEDGNYVIELFNEPTKKWEYITTEYSVSVATMVMVNIHNATKRKARVLSRRSKNMILSEV